MSFEIKTEFQLALRELLAPPDLRDYVHEDVHCKGYKKLRFARSSHSEGPI